MAWYSPREGISSRVSLWQNKADEHQEKQLINPFSSWEGASHRERMSRHDENYGRPVEGSKTEYRGQRAGVMVTNEIYELCRIIRDNGYIDEQGNQAILFGKLFEIYTNISNKLVGMLMRARKQSLITFEGEMLFQRRDDNVVVTLLQMPEPPADSYVFTKKY